MNSLFQIHDSSVTTDGDVVAKPIMSRTLLNAATAGQMIMMATTTKAHLLQGVTSSVTTLTAPNMDGATVGKK